MGERGGHLDASRTAYLVVLSARPGGRRADGDGLEMTVAFLSILGEGGDKSGANGRMRRICFEGYGEAVTFDCLNSLGGSIEGEKQKEVRLRDPLAFHDYKRSSNRRSKPRFVAMRLQIIDRYRKSSSSAAARGGETTRRTLVKRTCPGPFDLAARHWASGCAGSKPPSMASASGRYLDQRRRFFRRPFLHRRASNQLRDIRFGGHGNCIAGDGLEDLDRASRGREEQNRGRIGLLVDA